MNTSHCLFLILFVSFFDCKRSEDTLESNSSPSQIEKDSVQRVEIETDSIDAPESDEDAELRNEYELNFVLSVADGYNYDSLHAIAVDVSKLLHFKFDTFDRYYDPRRGIILPDNHEDEIYAGNYLLRREGGDIISLERTFAYIDTSMAKVEEKANLFYQDTSRMFVFATMYPDKWKADSLKKILQKKYPSTKVIATEIFTGCMH